MLHQETFGGTLRRLPVSSERIIGGWPRSASNERHQLLSAPLKLLMQFASRANLVVRRDTLILITLANTTGH